MKKKQTPMEYAKKLYMADRCNGAKSVLDDHSIIGCRVMAFIDGVNWQKRQARKATVPKRSPMVRAWESRRKKYGPSGQRPAVSPLKR